MLISSEASSSWNLFSEPKQHLALVTGGSRGIGKAIAEGLSACGIQVLTPGRADLDLGSPESILKFTEAYQDRGIDILVNNAGINVIDPLEKISLSNWSQMLQINLTASFQLTQRLSPGMQKKKWGRVLNISSVFGVVTKEKRAAYSATKSGLNGLTRTSAVELGPYGILVNSLCPGYVDTELTRKNNSPQEIAAIEETIPLRRMADTQEIARLAVFLCSDYNSYITGQNVLIDGGFTCK
jgi:3-oxoacyl-[acyl-carrier protein] reductase